MVTTDSARHFETVCRTLADGSGQGGWQWDDRLGAALVVFGEAQAAKMLTLLRQVFPEHWDANTIKSAGNNVSDIVRNLGGLKKNQIIFATDPNQKTFLYGAWWPWGDGKQISLRVFFACANAHDPEKTQIANAFRQWFGLAPKT